MAASKKQTWLSATETVVVWDDDGVRSMVTKGDLYEPNHWIVKRLGRDFFITSDELALRQGRVVEQATAAPGETRNVKVPTE